MRKYAESTSRKITSSLSPLPAGAPSTSMALFMDAPLSGTELVSETDDTPGTRATAAATSR